MSLCSSRFPTRASLLPSSSQAQSPSAALPAEVGAAPNQCVHAVMCAAIPLAWVLTCCALLGREQQRQGTSVLLYRMFHSPAIALCSSEQWHSQLCICLCPGPEPCCHKPLMESCSTAFPFGAAWSLRLTALPRLPGDATIALPSVQPCAGTGVVTQEQSLLGAAQTPLSASSLLKIPFPEEPCKAPQVFGFTCISIINLSRDSSF